MPTDYDDEYPTCLKTHAGLPQSIMMTWTPNGSPACWVSSRAKPRSKGGAIQDQKQRHESRPAPHRGMVASRPMA